MRPNFCETSIFLPSSNIWDYIVQTLLIIILPDLFKIIISCMCNGIWNRILYYRLYDQRIPHLQSSCTGEVLYCHHDETENWRRAFQNRHCSKAELKFLLSWILAKRNRLIKSSDMGLWHMQQWLNWNEGISVTVHVERKSVSLRHLAEFVQIRTLQTNPLYGNSSVIFCITI